MTHNVMNPWLQAESEGSKELPDGLRQQLQAEAASKALLEVQIQQVIGQMHLRRYCCSFLGGLSLK